MADSSRVPEAFVAWLWERRVAGRLLQSTDGRPVEVIYPGRRWGSWGPDFRGALLVLGGEVVRGDVEVHVRARDWIAHGHSRDPAYRLTALHVVFATPDRRERDAVALPTVALAPLLPQSLPTLLAQWEQGKQGLQPVGNPKPYRLLAAGPARPVPDPCRSPEEARILLTEAGLARLESKAARFEGDLTCIAPVEALLTGILEALGYAANVEAFRRLVARIPLAPALAAAQTEGTTAATALLLGEAGLLPSQRGLPAVDDYSLHAEALWRATGRTGPAQSLGWRWVGSRPSNGPVRRVAAAAALLGPDESGQPEGPGRAWGPRGEPSSRSPRGCRPCRPPLGSGPRPPGLDEAVLGALHELPPRQASGALRDLLARAGEGYWRAHSDFGRPLRRSVAVLGAERAADAVVNVVLPWALALGRHWGDRATQEAARTTYLAHPLLSTNQVTRHMAAQVAGERAAEAVTGACQQQGLIHLYQGWCEGRNCEACPAGDGPLVQCLNVEEEGQRHDRGQAGVASVQGRLLELSRALVPG